MSVARPLTLADVAAPQSNALTNTLLVVAASLVTAAAALFPVTWKFVSRLGGRA